MRAAIYARVSTKQQREEGSSLNSQIERCLQTARAEGYDVPSAYIFQEDWPGNELGRPELNHVRELVRQQAISAVLVYSTDRLARKAVHVGLIVEECQRNDVRLVFVTEPLDTSPEGMLIAYVKGYANELEREKIKDRSIRGKIDRARGGRLPQGTGRGTYGYRYDPDTGRRVVVEQEAEVVRRMFRLAIEGHSVYQIAQILNKECIPNFSGRQWRSQTIRYILRNSAYAGTTHFGKTRRIALEGKRRKLESRERDEWLKIPGATPMIVSMEEFDEAQRALAMPKRICSPSQRYLLTGHAVCGLCGGPISGSMLAHRYRYYNCRRRWHPQTRSCGCQARYIGADSLEEAVFGKLRGLVENPELVMAEVERRKAEGGSPYIDQELKRTEAEINGCRNWEARMVKLYGYGEIDDELILRETRRSKAKREQLEEERKGLLRQKREIEQLEVAEDTAQEFCQRVRERLGQFGSEDKRLLLAALQIKVIVYPDHVEVQGAIPSYATIEQTSA